MEMKNPHVIWAAVVIIFVLVAGATLLALKEKDVTVILSLAVLVAVPVLTAFGAALYHKLDQVKEISNGNMSRAQQNQERTQQQLAQLALLLPTEVQARAQEILAEGEEDKTTDARVQTNIQLPPEPRR